MAFERRTHVGGSRPPAELVELCERMWPRLVGTLSLYTHDRGVAEELTQDALLRVCRDWQKVRELEVPDAWVHRVAMNLANSHFRRRMAAGRAHRRLAGRRRDEHVAGPDPVGMAVRDAVASLPERERAALVLRYHADLSVADVASALRCPPNTVKTLTRRAIERLRSSGFLVDDEDEAHEVLDGR